MNVIEKPFNFILKRNSLKNSYEIISPNVSSTSTSSLTSSSSASSLTSNDSNETNYKDDNLTTNDNNNNNNYDKTISSSITNETKLAADPSLALSSSYTPSNSGFKTIITNNNDENEIEVVNLNGCMMQDQENDENQNTSYKLHKKISNNEQTENMDLTNDNNEANCDCCNKIGKRENFKGTLCSKFDQRQNSKSKHSRSYNHENNLFIDENNNNNNLNTQINNDTSTSNNTNYSIGSNKIVKLRDNLNTRQIQSKTNNNNVNKKFKKSISEYDFNENEDEEADTDNDNNNEELKRKSNKSQVLSLQSNIENCLLTHIKKHQTLNQTDKCNNINKLNSINSKIDNQENDIKVEEENKSQALICKIKLDNNHVDTTINDNFDSKLNTFNWNNYLKETNSKPVPKYLFKNPFPKNLNEFEVGMRLEGVDLKHPTYFCVLSVAQVNGYRIRLHFDEYDYCYDFWCNADSKFIYPVGHCEKNNLKLTPPSGYSNKSFKWCEYLKDKVAAPGHLFNFKYNHGISSQVQIGMKLEAVDKHNPILIRVATIVNKNKTKIKIHYDGWPDDYDVWSNYDSDDLHPIYWCEKTGHSLICPPNLDVPKTSTCPTPGCYGIGNTKGYKYVSHHSESGCPYAIKNLNKNPFPDRLSFNKLDMSNTQNTSEIIQDNHSNSQNKRVLNKLKINQTIKRRKISLFFKNKQLSQHESDKLNLKKSICETRRGRPPKKPKISKVENNEYKVTIHDTTTSIEEDIYETVHLASSKPKYQFPFFIKYNKKIIPEISNYSLNEVKAWSVNEVTKFVESLRGCESSADVFLEQQIDGQSFLLLQQEDLIKILKLKLGPAIKIFNSILAFKQLVE